jgi:hypothetical protein
MQVLVDVDLHRSNDAREIHIGDVRVPCHLAEAIGDEWGGIVDGCSKLPDTFDKGMSGTDTLKQGLA